MWRAFAVIVGLVVPRAYTGGYNAADARRDQPLRIPTDPVGAAVAIAIAACRRCGLRVGAPRRANAAVHCGCRLRPVRLVEVELCGAAVEVLLEAVVVPCRSVCFCCTTLDSSLLRRRPRGTKGRPRPRGSQGTDCCTRCVLLLPPVVVILFVVIVVITIIATGIITAVILVVIIITIAVVVVGARLLTLEVVVLGRIHSIHGRLQVLCEVLTIDGTVIDAIHVAAIIVSIVAIVTIAAVTVTRLIGIHLR